MAILYYYIDAQKKEQLSFEHIHIKKDTYIFSMYAIPVICKALCVIFIRISSLEHNAFI